MPAKFTMSPDSSLGASATSVTSQPTTTAPIREPSRIRNVYVSSLPLGYTDSQLFELLSPFGAIASCRMFNDNKGTVTTGHSYGFVLFERSSDAAAACEALDGFTLVGRKLRVQLARNGLAKKAGIQPPPPPAATKATPDSQPMPLSAPSSAAGTEWQALGAPYALHTTGMMTHWIPMTSIPGVHSGFALMPGGPMCLPPSPYFAVPGSPTPFPPPPVCAPQPAPQQQPHPPSPHQQPATVVYGFSPVGWPPA